MEEYTDHLEAKGMQLCGSFGASEATRCRRRTQRGGWLIDELRASSLVASRVRRLRLSPTCRSANACVGCVSTRPLSVSVCVPSFPVLRAPTARRVYPRVSLRPHMCSVFSSSALQRMYIVTSHKIIHHSTSSPRSFMQHHSQRLSRAAVAVMADAAAICKKVVGLKQQTTSALSTYAQARSRWCLRDGGGRAAGGRAAP
eukprot:scaffold1523_cov140-Isochrysis_galbana.AAC.3